MRNLLRQVKPFRFVDPARIGDDLRRLCAAARAGLMRAFGFAPAGGADKFIRLKQMRFSDPNGRLFFFVKQCNVTSGQASAVRQPCLPP